MIIYRLVVGIASFLRLVWNPNGLDAVVRLADQTRDEKILGELVVDFKRAPLGPEALSKRTRLGQVDVQKLHRLPKNTLGYAFAEYLVANGLKLEDLPDRPNSTDLEYVEAHLYETHDIWHTVTGFDTTVAGELGLQGFYHAQTSSRLPVVLFAAGSLNTLLFNYGDARRRMDAIVYGWNLGKNAKSLLGVQWTDLWEKPLAEVQKEFSITPYEASPIQAELTDRASRQVAHQQVG